MRNSEFARTTRNVFRRHLGRVNYDGASFIGATICALSLFFPWVVRQVPPWYRWPPVVPPLDGAGILLTRISWHLKMEWSFIDLLFDRDFTLVLLIFLAGAVLSLFYRIGIVPQMLGLAGFVLAAGSRFSPSPNLGYDPIGQYSFGPGFAIALCGVLAYLAANNFWWQRESSVVVPTISRVTALAPNSTRLRRQWND